MILVDPKRMNDEGNSIYLCQTQFLKCCTRGKGCVFQRVSESLSAFIANSGYIMFPCKQNLKLESKMTTRMIVIHGLFI